MFSQLSLLSTHINSFLFSFSANQDIKVDQRIIDMVRDSYSEDKSISDEVITRPKSSSFMSRSGSFTTKGSKDKGDKGIAVKKQDNDEKEKENTKDEKSLQQFNKNVSHKWLFNAYFRKASHFAMVCVILQTASCSVSRLDHKKA